MKFRISKSLISFSENFDIKDSFIYLIVFFKNSVVIDFENLKLYLQNSQIFKRVLPIYWGIFKASQRIEIVSF